MKRKLLATLLTLSMILCLTPTMAFAAEAEPTAEQPATSGQEAAATEQGADTELALGAEKQKDKEEQANQIEEVAKENQETSSIEEPTANLEEEKAVLNPAIQVWGPSIGHFEGYNFVVDFIPEGEGFQWQLVVTVNGRTVLNSEFLDNKKISAAIEKALNEEGNDCCTVVVETAAHYYHGIGSYKFYKLNTTATIDSETDKDVAFKYDVDSIYGQDRTTKEIEDPEYKMVWENPLKKNEKATYEWIKNTLTIAKGAKTVTDNLILRIDEDYGYIAGMYDEISGQTTDFVFVKEAEVTDGISKDGTVWGIVDKKWYDRYSQEELTFSMDALADKNLVKAINLTNYKNDSAAFIAAVNTAYAKIKNDYEQPHPLFTFTIDNPVKAVLDKASIADEMTFTHTVITTSDTTSKKCVQTADSNELGLWIALGMLAIYLLFCCKNNRDSVK